MSRALREGRPEACLSDFKLDELVAGELDAAASREARAHVAACPSCAGRSAAREAERDAFQAEAPSFAELAELAARAGAKAPEQGAPSKVVPLAAPRPRGRRLLVAAGSVAAAGAIAAAAAFALFFRVDPAGDVAGDGTRIKGGARVGFFVKRGDAVARGASGERVAPGDALQLTYTTQAPAHLAVLSVDASGAASVYYPAGPRAERIEPGREVPLPSSVVLDDTLGEERIFALFCADPIEIEPVRAALAARPASLPFPSAALPSPPLPASCEVDAVTLHKIQRPR